MLRNDPDEAEKFKEEDSVVLNPNEEEIEEQIVKMEARRARVKAAKKAAKAAKKGNSSDQVASDGFKRPGIPDVSSDQSLTEEPFHIYLPDICLLCHLYPDVSPFRICLRARP